MVSFFRRKRDVSTQSMEKDLLGGIQLDSTGTLVMQLSCEGTITSINGDLHLIQSFEFLAGHSIMDIIHRDEHNRFKAMLQTVLEGNIKISETILLNQDQLQADLSFFPVFSEDGDIKKILCLATDVYEKQTDTLNIMDYIQKFHFNSHEFIGLLDTNGKILYESQTAESLLGFDPVSTKGSYFLSYIHKKDAQQFLQTMNESIECPTVPFTTELTIRDHTGEWHIFETVFTNLLDNKEVGAILICCRDITELKNQQSKILYLSSHDQFTGLPNHKAFKERLDLEVKLATLNAQIFGVIHLKLDDLHILSGIGTTSLMEQFVKVFSQHLIATFSRKIEMISKSDETSFYILTKNLKDSSLIMKFVEELIEFLKQPINFQQYQLTLQSKVGVSIFPHTSLTTNELLVNSKSASYLASKVGTADYHISSKMDLEVMKKLFSIRNDLKFSLQKQQFNMLYEPIFATNTDLIDCVEALVRWEHPLHGTITPREFFHVAEEYELLHDISKWVLHTVLNDLSKWHSKGFMVRAAINFSPIQFEHPHFIDMVNQILDETAIDPSWINIEINKEYKFNELNTIKRIRELQEIGFHISLDNFGTGYNSFKNLKLIKPNSIKIDKSFTEDMLTNSDSKNIISSIMHMAGNLDIQVVADGVETVEQKSYLQTTECDYVQGLLYSRPISTEVMGKMLAQQWIKPELLTVIKTEQRKYFRISLDFPLESTMTVSELNGKKVEINKAKILVKNIGPGGLLFLSPILLPSDVNLTLTFDIKLFGENHSFNGSIVHSSEKSTLYHYGVEFRMTTHQRDKYISIFNMLQLRLKNSPTLPDHSFVIENVYTYFKKDNE